jgi:hypothetical protein
MSLAAMVGLMVEQMQEYVRENLRLWHSGRGPITKEATQDSFIILSDGLDQPIVFLDTSLG